MNFINNLVAKAKATTTKAAETIDSAAKSIITEKIFMVSVDKLHFDKDYKAVFTQEEDKVNRIAEDMKTNGFDKSQPIIVNSDFAILDGNSRYMATQIAGIKKVPVIVKQFESKKDAILYELNLQMNRRNIASDDVLIETYHRLAGLTDEKGNKLFTDVEIAQRIGVSPRQVSKAKEVELKASEEIKESLSEGKISLNMAYNQMKEEIKPAEKKAEPLAEMKSVQEKSADDPSDENKTYGKSEETPAETTSVDTVEAPAKPKKASSEKSSAERLNLRFKPEDFALVKTAADAANVSVSEYVMNLVMSSVQSIPASEKISEKETA